MHNDTNAVFGQILGNDKLRFQYEIKRKKRQFNPIKMSRFTELNNVTSLG